MGIILVVVFTLAVGFMLYTFATSDERAACKRQSDSIVVPSSAGEKEAMEMEFALYEETLSSIQNLPMETDKEQQLSQCREIAQHERLMLLRKSGKNSISPNQRRVYAYRAKAIHYVQYWMKKERKAEQVVSNIKKARKDLGSGKPKKSCPISFFSRQKKY